MSAAKLAVGACAVMALLSTPFAEAKGGRGGGSRAGGHHSHGHHAGSRHHAGHGFRYTGVFVGASYVLWPRAYYWPDYNPGVRAVEYWYYCEPYAAYYPYVQECPTEWQPVLPTAPSSGS